MSKREEFLLLFDIDGTLIDTEGAGLFALTSGFYDAFPSCEGSEFPPLDLAGATDGSVVEFLFAHFRITDGKENRDTFFNCYARSLAAQLAAFSEVGKGSVLPGVLELLSRLEGRDEFLLGLLTGNIERGARLKLGHFGIDRYFRVGAYGCDHSLRNELGPVAMRRAEEVTGVMFAPHRTIIIGDTPKDVACARSCGAHAIAVATGGVSVDELIASAPDVFLEDLSNTEEVMAVLCDSF